ncbi:hypothetical protein MSG28_011150 [Choristoneura fumiferana]|uniref:Uncharacterized protein n=1 Tax=Choristoneura fumiferana TaxID=7141 RepID=A0ACC0KR51_CHOFU|nr:hypothetical protein MSG28_011150 [Choristoneura fumiferana]
MADSPSEVETTGRFSRPSLAQVKAIIDFMQKHPELANRKFRYGMNHDKFRKLWYELSSIANSIEGAVKSTKGWIKFWSDKRRSIKLKQKQIDEGKLDDRLSPVERKIYDLSLVENSISPIKKKKGVKQEPVNGDEDESNDDSFLKEVDEMDFTNTESNKLLVTEADERQMASCEGQNIVSVQVGVPDAVQVYSLSRNAISELDNYCFKEAGYSSIEVLNLSYNVIFWIGLHAFAGLDKLVHLDLSNNRLRYIALDLFFESPQLHVLDLSGNVFESLKNEPFINHTKLQVLNLNNCRIKSLPDRMFSRLPNLKKLDLSENYLVSLNTEVLRPLRKLERIELRNDYWNCDPSFMAVETWITSHGINYVKQCVKKTPKMFEKMISAVPVERVDVDVSDIWNITIIKNETLPVLKPSKELTWFQKIDQEFSASQAFVIGLELGLALGIVCTYVWLRALCGCRRVNCARPLTRRQQRRAQRMADSDMRTNLLWSSAVNPDLETPPSYRRRLSLPDGSAPYPTYGIPGPRGTIIQADAIRLPDRGETPPPPYHECRINI